MTDNSKGTKSATVLGLTNGVTYEFQVLRIDGGRNWVVSSGTATPDGAFDNELTSLDSVESAQASNGESAQIATINLSRGVVVAISNNGLGIEVSYTYETTPGNAATRITARLGTKSGSTLTDYNSPSTGLATKVAGASRSYFFPFPSPAPGRIVSVNVTVKATNGSNKSTMTFVVV